MRFYCLNHRVAAGKITKQKAGEIWRGQRGEVPSPSPYAYTCIKREVHVIKFLKIYVFCYTYIHTHIYIKIYFSSGKSLIVHMSSSLGIYFILSSRQNKTDLFCNLRYVSQRTFMNMQHIFSSPTRTDIGCT